MFNIILVWSIDLLKELLTRHKMLAADFLEANYDQVLLNKNII